jgi:hypothetical protein
MRMRRLLAGILTACVLMPSPLAAQTYETVTVHNTTGWPNVEPKWFAFQKSGTIRYNLSPGGTWTASAPRIEITQPTVINRIAGAMVAGPNPGNNFANTAFKIHVHSDEQHFADQAQSGDVFNRSGGYVANLGENNLPPALGVVNHNGFSVHWVEIGFEPFLLQPGSYVFNVQGYVYGHVIAWTQTGLNFDAPSDIATNLGNEGLWFEYGSGYYADWTPHSAILIQGEVEVPQCPISADLNCDGVVNVSDLLILLGDWGPCVDPDACPADLNDDGVVNVSDLLILLSNWG